MQKPETDREARTFAPAEIFVGSLQELWAEGPPWARAQAERHGATGDGAGTAVIVHDGIRVVEPLRLRFTESSALCLWLGKGSALVLSEHLAGSAETWSHRHEAWVGEGAELSFTSLQDLDAGATFRGKTLVRVAGGGKSAVRLITLGAHTVDHDVRTEVAGPDATAGLTWAFYARGTEDYRLTERTCFQAPRGSGETVMRGVAEERARVKCEGMIQIDPNGGGTDTYLTQQVLMLDPTARADAVPGLMIKTNDVKASHSASISQVSAEDLFYLSARGIPREQARRMFVAGYVEDMARQVEDTVLRQAILAAVERKMAESRVRQPFFG